jgi:hypothetical protein
VEVERQTTAVTHGGRGQRAPTDILTSFAVHLSASESSSFVSSRGKSNSRFLTDGNSEGLTDAIVTVADHQGAEPVKEYQLFRITAIFSGPNQATTIVLNG